MQFITNQFNVCGYYQVDRSILAAGLCVDKKFRGKGIATQILKARAPLMRAIGASVTSSLFSTAGAQKAAQSAGYDTNYSIDYEALQKQFPEMDFSSLPLGTSCKILSMKI